MSTKDLSLLRPGLFSGRWLSPLGKIVLASDGQSIVGLWFEGQKYFGSTLSDVAVEDEMRPEFEATRRWLSEYFSGRRSAGIPAIRLVGTEFQQRVWRELLALEWGTTTTYGRLAASLGSSPRAVGGAVGRNPISLIIPCHRVLGSASLTGYAAGIDIKRTLLDIESSGKRAFPQGE